MEPQGCGISLSFEGESSSLLYLLSQYESRSEKG